MGLSFPLLVAAFTVEVDVLLPTLYFACSECSIDEILDEAGSMTRGCMNTLIRGRIYMDNEIHALIVELPDDLLEVVGSGECSCSRNEPCLRNARFADLSELVGQKFSAIHGSRVVARHLSPICTNCSSFVTKAIDKRREEIWDDIPSHFGFFSWDALEARLKEITEPKQDVSIVFTILNRVSDP